MITKFLLAEDDEDDYDMFREALNEIRPELELLRAKNGKEALARLRSITSIPDVIFLDVNMPEMNGWKCLSALKADNTWAKIPVLLYSTSSPDLYGKQAIEGGATGFYEKPINFQSFKDFLRAVANTSPENLPQTLQDLKASGQHSLFIP